MQKTLREEHVHSLHHLHHRLCNEALSMVHRQVDFMWRLYLTWKLGSAKPLQRLVVLKAG